MATTSTPTPAPARLWPADGGFLPYKLTVRRFGTMIVTGVFPEGARVELLGGVLAETMTKSTPHNFAVRRLGGLIREPLGRDWVLSEEKSVELGKHWRPEPDISVASGPHERYRANDPKAKDVQLIVEVAGPSYAVDRGKKWAGYAAAKVPVYWVVNLGARAVEVDTKPAGRGDSARYTEVKVYGPNDSAPVVVGGRELGAVPLKEILP